MIKERQLQQYNELKNIKCQTTGFKGGNPTISKFIQNITQLLECK